MKRKLTEDFIKQNLKGAGCDGDTIDCILECCVNGNIKKRKKLFLSIVKNYWNKSMRDNARLIVLIIFHIKLKMMKKKRNDERYQSNDSFNDYFISIGNDHCQSFRWQILKYSNSWLDFMCGSFVGPRF